MDVGKRRKSDIPDVIKYPFAWFQLTLLAYALGDAPRASRPGAITSRNILVWPTGMSKKIPPAILNNADEDMVLLFLVVSIYRTMFPLDLAWSSDLDLHGQGLDL